MALLAVEGAIIRRKRVSRIRPLANFEEISHVLSHDEEFCEGESR